MEDNHSQICFYSYNTRGHGANKLQFINDIVKLPSRRDNIFSIQVHFLLRNNLYKLTNAFEDFAVIAKPAFKNFHSSSSGRPMGGLATILPKKYRKLVELIHCSSWRLQPFLLKLQNETIMIINTYFQLKIINRGNHRFS